MHILQCKFALSDLMGVVTHGLKIFMRLKEAHQLHFFFAFKALAGSAFPLMNRQAYFAGNPY